MISRHTVMVATMETTWDTRRRRKYRVALCVLVPDIVVFCGKPSIQFSELY